MVKDASRSFFDSLNKSKRLAIISDMHGNLDALQAVMKDAKEKGVSAFLNAGDIVGSGAYPEEVVSLIKGSTMVSVSGNFDFKVLEFARASQRPRSRSIKRAIVAAAARDLSDDSLEFLSSLPMEQRLELNGKKLLMVHASPADPDEHLGPQTEESRLSELASIAGADIVVVGHSHVPFTRRVKDVLFVNPGSVGRPGDHDPRASYAIMDMDTFDIEVRRIEYDVEAAVEAIQVEGIPDVVADMIRKGLPSNEVKEVSPRRSSGANIRRAD